MTYMKHAEVPDLVYASNNGTLFIVPTQNGRLGHLSICTKIVGERKQPQKIEKGWVFGDYTFGDEIDWCRRGVVSGTSSEGSEFIEKCRRIGLIVKHDGRFVPFSNGQRRYGRFEAHMGVSLPFADYDEYEYSCCRVDLPKIDELEVLLRE